MAEQEPDPRITLLEKAWATPAARPLMEKAFKTAFPNAEVPGLALREATETVEKKLFEKEAAIDAKLAKFETDRQHEMAVSGLKQQGYSPDQIKEIEKIMVEEGVGLHVNAAVIYDARTKVAPPRTTTSQYNSMSPARAYGKGQYAPFFHGIMDGPFQNPGEDWARDTVDTILQDFATDRATAEKKWTDDNYWPESQSYRAAKKA
jgi:hypothetical protein